MATELSVSLRIYAGLHDSGLASRPLVAVGEIPVTFHPTPPTLVDEPRVWMITHAQEHTVYSMFVHESAAADDTMQMLIVLFVPAQMRLADGVGPLGLLNTIFDMASIGLAHANGQTTGTLQTNDFETLLKRYKLEERQMKLPLMEGKAAAAFCVGNTSQLDAIMRFSRYHQLAKVGRLELGFKCKSTIVLPTGTKPPVNKDEPAKAEKKEKSHLSAAVIAILVVGIGIGAGYFFISDYIKGQNDSVIVSLFGNNVDENIEASNDLEQEDLKKVDENADREAARLDLFRRVGQNPKMGLRAYRILEGYKYLTQKEKVAIECLMNIEQFRHNVDMIGWEELQDIQNRTYEFNSIQDIKDVQMRIWRVISDNPRNKNNQNE